MRPRFGPGHGLHWREHRTGARRGAARSAPPAVNADDVGAFDVAASETRVRARTEVEAELNDAYRRVAHPTSIGTIPDPTVDTETAASARRLLGSNARLPTLLPGPVPSSPLCGAGARIVPLRYTATERGRSRTPVAVGSRGPSVPAPVEGTTRERRLPPQGRCFWATSGKRANTTTPDSRSPGGSNVRLGVGGRPSIAKELKWSVSRVGV